jgi:hypothetical protein
MSERSGMADNDTKAVIVLTEGNPLNVQESVDQIMSLIEGVTSRHIPLIKVTDERGIEHQINAQEIVQFHEPIPYRSAGFART